MQLGVGLAFFADNHQLRAEAEEGQGAVEGRELVGLREILAFRGPAGEVGPVGLEEATGHGDRGSHAEAQRQRVGSREAAPGSREAMRTQVGFFFAIAGARLRESEGLACQCPDSEKFQWGPSRSLKRGKVLNSLFKMERGSKRDQV